MNPKDYVIFKRYGYSVQGYLAKNSGVLSGDVEHAKRFTWEQASRIVKQLNKECQPSSIIYGYERIAQ